MAMSRYQFASQARRPWRARWGMAGSTTWRWVERNRASSRAAPTTIRAATQAGRAATASFRTARARRVSRRSPLRTGETNQIRMFVVGDGVHRDDFFRRRPERGQLLEDALARQ